MATLYQNTVSAATAKPKTPEEQAAAGQQTGAAGTTQPAGTPTGQVTSQTPAQAAQQASAEPKPKPTGTETTGGTTPTGNQTTATPTANTGSNLPAYAASFNFWQNNSAPGMGSAPEGAVYTPNAQTDHYSNLPQYDANGVQIPTWQTQAGNSNPALTALQSILSGDASGMDTSAMKNKLKEQRLQMEKDQRTGSQQAAAGRGMLDSGYQQGQERRIAGEARKDILGGYRDVDIAAAEASTRNKIAGSEALNTVLTGDTSREATRYNTVLGGATQQDSQNQFGATHGLATADSRQRATNEHEQLRQKGAQSILDKYKTESANTMEGRSQDIQVAQAKSNELLGRLGLAVNLEQIAKSSSRDKMQFITDIFNTLVQNEQHNASLGLGYAQLGMSVDQMMGTLIQGLGL